LDTKEIFKWTARIIIIISLVVIISVLSDKYGKDMIILNGLAFALLLYSIGKLLLKKK